MAILYHSTSERPHYPWENLCRERDSKAEIVWERNPSNTKDLQGSTQRGAWRAANKDANYKLYQISREGMNTRCGAIMTCGIREIACDQSRRDKAYYVDLYTITYVDLYTICVPSKGPRARHLCCGRLHWW